MSLLRSLRGGAKHSVALLTVVISISYSAEAFDHSHAGWNTVLKKYVDVKGPRSLVRYKAIKEAPGSLDAYLAQLSKVTSKEYDAWSKDQQLAFLMNAYNAFTIKIIVDNYPVKTIREIGSLFTSTWKKKFFTLLGKERHLDYIEHDRIRKDFNESRIHFALVCAAMSCPPLRGEAYLADKLNAQLESQAKLFLGDSGRNEYEEKSKTLKLSSIFKWYGKDFEKSHGSVQVYVAKFMTSDKTHQELISNEKVKLKYLDYDWALNEIK